MLPIIDMGSGRQKARSEWIRMSRGNPLASTISHKTEMAGYMACRAVSLYSGSGV
jgi:hypothetical protein